MRSEGPTCPECKSKSIAPIVYGLPGPKLMEESRRGDVVLGGCVVTDDDPIQACRDCGYRWGDNATDLEQRARPPQAT